MLGRDYSVVSDAVPIFLSGLNCDGQMDESLLGCESVGIFGANTQRCTHQQDVHVHCEGECSMMLSLWLRYYQI